MTDEGRQPLFVQSFIWLQNAWKCIHETYFSISLRWTWDWDCYRDFQSEWATRLEPIEFLLRSRTNRTQRLGGFNVSKHAISWILFKMPVTTQRTYLTSGLVTKVLSRTECCVFINKMDRSLSNHCYVLAAIHHFSRIWKQELIANNSVYVGDLTMRQYSVKN